MATQAKTFSDVMNRLDAMKSGTDQEIAHSEADMLLCDALLIAGKHDVVEAFLSARDRVGFWYA